MAFEAFHDKPTVTEEDVAYDDCYNDNCRYFNMDESKCSFETCVFKELPKHTRAVTQKCIVCNSTYSCSVEDIRFYLCPKCISALRHVIIKHRAECNECGPIKPRVPNIDEVTDQFKNGSGGAESNADWNH